MNFKKVVEMSEFIKSIGNARYNGFGADLYENKNGSATIRFDKNTRNLPKKHWLTFSSLEDAEKFIEIKQGSSGFNTLVSILNAAEI